MALYDDYQSAISNKVDVTWAGQQLLDQYMIRGVEAIENGLIATLLGVGGVLDAPHTGGAADPRSYARLQTIWTLEPIKAPPND